MLITLLFDSLVMLVCIKLISGKDEDELSIPVGMVISFFVAIVTVFLVIALVEPLGLLGVVLALVGGSVVLAVAVINVFHVEPTKAFIIAGIFFFVKLVRENVFLYVIASTADEARLVVEPVRVLPA